MQVKNVALAADYSCKRDKIIYLAVWQVSGTSTKLEYI